MKTLSTLLIALVMFGFTTDTKQKSYLTISDDYVFFAFKGDATEQELEAARLRLRKEAKIEITITNEYDEYFSTLRVKTDDGFEGKAESKMLRRHYYLGFYLNNQKDAQSAFFVGLLPYKLVKKHQK